MRSLTKRMAFRAPFSISASPKAFYSFSYSPLAMVSSIFLVRHAEAESNAKSYYGGWTDSPLTALGLKQAASLKKRLNHEPIGRVFCSDSKRARDTLELLELKCPV